MLTLSRNVDECQPLLLGHAAFMPELGRGVIENKQPTDAEFPPPPPPPLLLSSSLRPSPVLCSVLLSSPLLSSPILSSHLLYSPLLSSALLSSLLLSSPLLSSPHPIHPPSPRTCTSIHPEGESCCDVGSSPCSQWPSRSATGTADGTTTAGAYTRSR